MNTNQLKKFAQDARRKLLEQVGAKLNFVLTTDSAELREKAEQLKQLRLELSRITKEQLIEKVAYTWFNRLMALRFMDANDYQPLGIRIITPKDGYTIPEMLDEAKRGNIPDELKVNRQRIYDLLDNKIPSTNPQNEAFKGLLIAACNHLSTTFPFLFEKINDYTELLLPDDLTSDFSVLRDVRDGMVIEDCQKVEIIGWLYQFYISEKKDEVFASKSKVRKEDIPAATQLFTPRWIVEYMVQNTLGKLWLQNRPKSRLRGQMLYYIESTSLVAEDFLKINSPEEIKFLDPASGSGHILVYAYDLFTKIYEEEGYNSNDIPKLIIEKNLFGFEIDERAAQLSALALMMKAREYHHRAFRKDILPNIVCFQDLYLHINDIKDTLNSLQINFSDKLLDDLVHMKQAKNFGSLIVPQASKSEISFAYERLKSSTINLDIFMGNKAVALQTSFFQLLKLYEKFDCVVMNPPYMGGNNMNKELSEFVKTNYPFSKADLMVCFMENAHNMLSFNGFLGMINIPSWMFLSSFERYRKFLIKTSKIESLLHLGRGIFGSDFGTVAFVFRKTNNINGIGVYRRLFAKHVQVRSIETIRTLYLNPSYGYYEANQNEFLKITGCPIGYWVSAKYFELFAEGVKLNQIASPRQGIATSNNERFLRQWYEIDNSSFFIGCKNELESLKSTKKWYPYNKGGTFRKWYGNNELVINWQRNGYEIKNSQTAVIRNPKYFFREGVTWTSLTSGIFNARYSTIGYLFDSKGPVLFPEKNDYYNADCYYLLALINSCVISSFLNILSPTLDFNQGPVGNIVLPSKIGNYGISEKCKSCVDISRDEWNSHETSWDFRKNEITNHKAQDIEEAFDLYQQYWKNKFFQLKLNEENLNKIFINLYELVEELSSNVTYKEISILNEESLIEKDKLRFVGKEVFAQFISYAVGCMSGRYSLDKEGLILANYGDTLQVYFDTIAKSKNKCIFLPDEDNIIPVLDDDWFEDDIVGKFNRFLKVTFGEKNFNKNLAFVEEQIGKDIRKYFIKDFYPDHIKRYKKRPIYWLFSSPKGSFNVLIYMHRYTPDTVSNILNKYLKEFIGKLNTRKEHLEHVQVTGSPSDKTKAIKEIDNIEKMLVELHEYERDVLYPLATERIEIDLDDGVLVNYNKFGKAVKEVNGLNDPATKKKVKQFDWVDTSQIR